ncbi:hypothetical protein O5833_29985, partial [Escherichia coli]|nr:hypothetical protein [Escherichia coli]
TFFPGFTFGVEPLLITLGFCQTFTLVTGNLEEQISRPDGYLYVLTDESSGERVWSIFVGPITNVKHESLLG